ncbi:uncharacterized protein LOC119657892 [Hermetia illucens]|uniref:uncharacterized protein LOC119657892 n=1 Tax=Hermetia illucens TaxID=343691 RepID=UPI0018CC7B7B|nr:uncharacterized protein LOC119657892 [Hermetia illucens]
MFHQERVDSQLPQNNSRYFIIHLATNADRANLMIAFKRQKQVTKKYPFASVITGASSVVACGSIGLALGCTALGLYSAFIGIEDRCSGGNLIRHHISPQMCLNMMSFICRELRISDSLPNYANLVMRLQTDPDFNRAALKALAKFYRKQLKLKVLPPW